MAARNSRRQAHQKPEEKPKDDAGTEPVTEPGNQEAPAPEPEKPDYGPLEAMAGEAANSEDYTPGSEPEQKSPSMGGKEMAVLFHLVFATASLRLGEHWKLSDGEAQGLGDATDAVLEKYGAKKAMGPEFTLVFTAGVVTLPRVLQTMAANGEQKPEETGSKTEAGEGAGDGGK